MDAMEPASETELLALEAMKLHLERVAADYGFDALWMTMAQEHAEPHDRSRCDGCAVLRAVPDPSSRGDRG